MAQKFKTTKKRIPLRRKKKEFLERYEPKKKIGRAVVRIAERIAEQNPEFQINEMEETSPTLAEKVLILNDIEKHAEELCKLYQEIEEDKIYILEQIIKKRRILAIIPVNITFRSKNGTLYQMEGHKSSYVMTIQDIKKLLEFEND